MKNLFSKFLPPYDAGIYEVQANMHGKPITIKMQDCNFVVAPSDTFRIMHNTDILTERVMQKYATISRFGSYEFYDELEEHHVFGAVFFAKEETKDA